MTMRQTLYTMCFLSLFATWVGLIVLAVPHAEELIEYIRMTLSALGAHVFTVIYPGQGAGPTTSPDKEPK